VVLTVLGEGRNKIEATDSKNSVAILTQLGILMRAARCEVRGARLSHASHLRSAHLSRARLQSSSLKLSTTSRFPSKVINGN
jgi:hypothetical protein